MDPVTDGFTRTYVCPGCGGPVYVSERFDSGEHAASYTMKLDTTAQHSLPIGRYEDGKLVGVATKCNEFMELLSAELRTLGALRIRQMEESVKQFMVQLPLGMAGH